MNSNTSRSDDTFVQIEGSNYLHRLGEDTVVLIHRPASLGSPIGKLVAAYVTVSVLYLVGISFWIDAGLTLGYVISIGVLVALLQVLDMVFRISNPSRTILSPAGLDLIRFSFLKPEHYALSEVVELVQRKVQTDSLGLVFGHRLEAKLRNGRTRCLFASRQPGAEESLAGIIAVFNRLKKD